MRIKAKKNFWQSLSSQIKTLLSSALGFVTALAWNDAIQALIKKIIPIESASSIILKFIYAILVTIVSVALVFYLFNVEKRIKMGLKNKK